VSATSPTATLQGLLEAAFPDADELSVVDRTGTGDHFQVTLASARFDGIALVDQHRLVYDALAAPLADGTIHELRIKTRGAARGAAIQDERAQPGRPSETTGRAAGERATAEGTT
jgi:stress-induced morphogen